MIELIATALSAVWIVIAIWLDAVRP